jgi:hypothetical protein
MSCDCIHRLEDLLTEKMKERFPNGEVIEPVEFQNKTLIFYSDSNKTGLILTNPVLGRVRIGKQTRKFDVDMYPKYCPYCGKPLEEEGGQQ